MERVQRFPVGHQDGPLDHVLKLADVSGPGVIREDVHRLPGNAYEGAPEFLGALLHAMFNEQGDIFPAFFQ